MRGAGALLDAGLLLRAAERERAAWAESDRAAAALRRLRAEACLATVRAGRPDTLSPDASWQPKRALFPTFG